MNILVTGGNGFIATNFTKLALEQGHFVVSLDNLSYASSEDNHNLFKDNKSYSFIHEDIRSKSIFSILESGNFDSIINFAAESHVDRSIKDDSIFISTNVNGTHNLLQACKKLIEKRLVKDTFRFIQISTDEVYGSLSSNEKPFTEVSPLKPSNPYSASKAAADLICLSYYRTYKFPVLITRCSNNYGPYQHPEKLIPLSISKIKNDLKIPLYGNGQQIRDWIYVDDHCHGILAVLERGTLGEVYNFGGSSELTNIDCAKKLIKQLKPYKKEESYIEFIKDRPGHDTRYAIDATKAFQQLNWAALNTYSQGIAKTIKWYNNNESWLNEITNNQEYKNWVKKNY